MANIFKTFFSGLKVLYGSDKEKRKWIEDNFSTKVEDMQKKSTEELVNNAIQNDVANMTVVGDVSVDTYSKVVGSVWSAVVTSGVGEALSSVSDLVETSGSVAEEALEDTSVPSSSTDFVVPVLSVIVSSAIVLAVFLI